jgi:hypothetical protein
MPARRKTNAQHHVEFLMPAPIPVGLHLDPGTTLPVDDVSRITSGNAIVGEVDSITIEPDGQTVRVRARLYEPLLPELPLVVHYAPEP